MPNNKYLRSTKRERELVNEARAKGFLAARTAGSHSPVDVFIWYEKDRMMRMIQVKTKKGKRMRIERDREVYTGVTVIKSTISWE